MAEPNGIPGGVSIGVSYPSTRLIAPSEPRRITCISGGSKTIWDCSVF
jgi:hypothetical protein